ncbi:hypothetical protein TPA0910_74780 [Streptomyces hygroscopicus subsp. sporocinereus]|uniref:Uncharacterized protein n=1 Tax=Streptomyces hygroscopicus TaxID=1912 RepID=A0ABQ3UBR9_STRHY|nr:hypothetical protein TPA0910_74780 [Streptomyces hygroscopicus]
MPDAAGTAGRAGPGSRADRARRRGRAAGAVAPRTADRPGFRHGIPKTTTPAQPHNPAPHSRPRRPATHTEDAVAGGGVVPLTEPLTERWDPWDDGMPE